jgi:Smg protein
MKENVLDVLMYLFENYIYDDPETTPDRDDLEHNLHQAGFSNNEIAKAFRWLDELAEQDIPEESERQQLPPTRLYHPDELQRLDLDCRGFMLQLENQGVLTPASREVVIDRLMALEKEDIDLDDLKWVILMVLFNQPGQAANYAWIEDLVFYDEQELRH